MGLVFRDEVRCVVVDDAGERRVVVVVVVVEWMDGWMEESWKQVAAGGLKYKWARCQISGGTNQPLSQTRRGCG